MHFLYFSLSPVISQGLEPIEVYTRCHLQLTGTIPKTSDATYKAVANNSLTPAVGCQKIFELGRFAANGVMVNRSNPLARRVVERVHNIHRNWFPQKNPSSIVSYTTMVVDYEEPALYLTRAAFLDKEKFSSILTLNSGLKGYRQPLNGTALPTMQRKRHFGVPTVLKGVVSPQVFRFAYYPWSSTAVSRATTPATIDVPDSKLTQFGVLQGVIAQSPLLISNMYVPFHFSYSAHRAALKSRGQSLQTPVNAHFGGGMIGSQGFIMTNTNLVRNQLPNGEVLIHRRLAARIHETLLCHELPTLTAADVAKDVIPTSNLTFRTSTACMRCHTSMDPMAHTFRNLGIGRTINGNANDNMYGYFTETIYQSPRFRNPAYFSTQDPKGSYAYRTLLDKKLVRGSVNSIAQLGSHLASSQDLYLCSAKKYYKYFLGVDVQLQNREKAGSKEYIHQQNVITLAARLRATQSVSHMLKDLFETVQYQSPDFGSTKEDVP